MTTLLVLAACLFVLGLLFGRRFGVLTLALGAGFVIDGYLGTTVGAVAAPYLAQYAAYVPAGLVVGPSLIPLLFAKGRHRTLPARVISAALYAAAGLVFVIAAPGTPASLTSGFAPVTANIGYVVTGLLGFALLEATFGKPSKKKAAEEPKH